MCACVCVCVCVLPDLTLPHTYNHYDNDNFQVTINWSMWLRCLQMYFELSFFFFFLKIVYHTPL